MKRIFTGLILIFLLFSGCEKSEIEQFVLIGTLKGKINTFDEFGYLNSDNENISVLLEGSEPLLSIVTDSTGHYEINDIPTGTYNLIISKKGYGEYQSQGIQIVGGNEPLYFNGSIIEKSSTSVESLLLEIVNNADIYIKGIVNHSYIIDEWSFRIPAIRYFINNVSNPSDINYLQTGTVSFNGNSGSQLETRLYVDRNDFPSGSKMYVIAYGCYGNEYGYYDILTNRFIFTSLGTASNIASITIP